MNTAQTWVVALWLAFVLVGTVIFAFKLTRWNTKTYEPDYL